MINEEASKNLLNKYKLLTQHSDGGENVLAQHICLDLLSQHFLNIYARNCLATWRKSADSAEGGGGGKKMLTRQREVEEGQKC